MDKVTRQCSQTTTIYDLRLCAFLVPVSYVTCYILRYISRFTCKGMYIVYHLYDTVHLICSLSFSEYVYGFDFVAVVVCLLSIALLLL